MGARLFTSDLHIGHDFVARLRGFESTSEHDQHIADTWASTVTKRDTVFVLGDLTAQGRPDPALELIKSLPGSKHFVSGNHDPVHPMHKGSWKDMDKYLDAFISVNPFMKIRLIDQSIAYLSHFPYMGDLSDADRTEIRFEQWRLPNLGERLIHGHTHIAEQRFHNGQLHVGWDAWGGPVTERVVIDAFTQGEGES